jgi:hypothetical protein
MTGTNSGARVHPVPDGGLTHTLGAEVARWVAESRVETHAMADAVARAIDDFPPHHRDRLFDGADPEDVRGTITRATARLIAYAADKGEPVADDEFDRAVFATLVERGNTTGTVQTVIARMFNRLTALRRCPWGHYDPAWVLVATDDAVRLVRRVSRLADSLSSGPPFGHLRADQDHVRTAALTAMCLLFDDDDDVADALRQLAAAAADLEVAIMDERGADNWLMPAFVDRDLLYLASEATCLDYWLRGDLDAIGEDSRPALRDTYRRIREVLFQIGKTDVSTESAEWRRRNDGPSALNSLARDALTALAKPHRDDVVTVLRAQHPWLWRPPLLTVREGTYDIDLLAFQDHARRIASPLEQPEKRIELIETLSEAVEQGAALLLPGLIEFIGRMQWLAGDRSVERWVCGEELDPSDLASLLTAFNTLGSTVDMDPAYHTRGRDLAQFRIGEIEQHPDEVLRLGDMHAWRLLPPMWHNRDDAIARLTEHYERLHSTSYAGLYAAAVCCSPVQWFEPTSVDVAGDPGRGWFEYGIVETWTTLAARGSGRSVNALLQKFNQRLPADVDAALRTGPLAPR